MVTLKQNILKVVKLRSEIIFNRLTYEFNSGNIKSVNDLNAFFQRISNTFTCNTIDITRCITELNVQRTDGDLYIKYFKRFLLDKFVSNELKFVRGC